MDTQPQTLASVGELALIDQLITPRPQPATTLLGPGDDAALVATDGTVLVSTDVLVQNQHFRFDWSTPYDIGRKAIAQNGADIEAMGGTPTSFVIGFAGPADTTVEDLHQFNEGLWYEATRIGSGIVGGDLVCAPQWVISVTVLGTLAGGSPVCRGGAQPGSVVGVCGTLGYSAAGYELLAHHIDEYEMFCQYHRVPHPPYGQGQKARLAGAQAMTDISDGLIIDLASIASASQVRINVSTTLLQRDYDQLISPASRLGSNAWDWILTGGEDHSLVAVFPHELPQGWRKIGEVDKGTPQICVDGQPWHQSGGWQSFSPSPTL